jgi:hypothetical protein
VDPVLDPRLLRKCESAGNRTWDLWICSQELRRYCCRGHFTGSYSDVDGGLHNLRRVVNVNSYAVQYINVFLVCCKLPSFPLQFIISYMLFYIMLDLSIQPH